jgi:hypothetical protein
MKLNDKVFFYLFLLSVLFVVLNLWDKSKWVVIAWAVSLTLGLFVGLFKPFRE